MLKKFLRLVSVLIILQCYLTWERWDKPGASLKAFRDFFEKSKVYGADIDRKILFKDKRILTEYVDRTDLEVYKKII